MIYISPPIFFASEGNFLSFSVRRVVTYSSSRSVRNSYHEKFESLAKTFAKILIPPASEYDILDIWRMTQRDIVSNTFDYFRPVSTSTWYLAAKRVKKLLENCCNRIGWPTITRKLWIPRYRLLQPYKLSPIELFFRSPLEFRGRHRNEIKLTATRLTFHITFIVLAKEEGRVSRIRWKYVQPSLCRIPHWMSPRCKL